MRYLYDDKQVEEIRTHEFHNGLQLGFALGAGTIAAACGLWALLVGMWS